MQRGHTLGESDDHQKKGSDSFHLDNLVFIWVTTSFQKPRCLVSPPIERPDKENASFSVYTAKKTQPHSTKNQRYRLPSTYFCQSSPSSLTSFRTSQ
jgi:hypothetical protein